MRKDKMQTESMYFGNYKNGQKKKGSKKITGTWQKEVKEVWAIFL